jgi:dolichyl-phosphate beta-glucosyltransferase
MSERWVVVPCYEEQERLSPEAFAWLAEQPGTRVLFVDDGSRDGTLELLRRVGRNAAGRTEVLRFEHNRGKPEAVRAGLRRAMDAGASVVAYLDADSSTPPDEMVRLMDCLERQRLDVVLGSRIKLLGTAVTRRALRHYTGRIFATAASLALDLGVYDTQCGAKAFRSTAALRAALERPFRSSWAFDVELLARLLSGSERTAPIAVDSMLEVPLRSWRHTPGSKVGPLDLPRALWDVARVGVELRVARGRRRR